jgi:hypothetical protein
MPTSARLYTTNGNISNTAKRKQADRQKIEHDKQQKLNAKPRRADRAKIHRSEATLLEEFCCLAKAINLLKLVPSALKRLLEFWKTIRQEGASVKFEWITCKNDYTAKKSDIITFLQDVESDRAFFIDDRKEVIENIRPRDEEIRLHSHCELQLADKFVDDDGVEHYLGCSKTSCHFCWSILQYTRLRTRGTHSKLYWACVFPFSVVSNQINRTLLIRGVRETQEKLIGKVSMIAKNENAFYSQHPPGTETLGRGSEDKEMGQKSQPRSWYHMLVDEHGNQTIT